MKKIILTLSIAFIALTGCTTTIDIKPTTTEATSTDLLSVPTTQRTLSASDVEKTTKYEFAVSDELINGIDTFSLNDSLTITANDNQTYSLYYSKNKDDNLEKIDPINFVTYNKELAKEGYYTLTSKDNMDVSISTL